MRVPGYGPLSAPVVIARMNADALGTLDEAHREFGDVIRFHLGASQMVMLCHPDHSHYVQTTHHRRFEKGELYDDLRPLLGEGLVTANGAVWQRQRTLIQPAFRREHLQRWGSIIEEETARTLEGWAAGGLVEASRALMELTFRVVCRTVFGSTEGLPLGLMYETFTEVSEAALAESRRLLRLPFWVPTLNHIRYRRAVAALEAPVAALLAQRRAQGGDGVDLFGLLMGARDEGDGSAMADRQLRDEGMTFLFAGHETTGNALAWALHELSLHPEVQEALFAEVAGLSAVPRVDELGRAPLLRRVCDEVLRLHPPVWWLERQSLEEETFDGHVFPAGTRFALSPHLTHRDPRWWDEPLRFVPDRGPPRHKAAWMPFANGPRQCIGSQLALQEMAQALGAVVRAFVIAPGPDPVRPDPVVTVRVKGGLRVQLQPRGGALGQAGAPPR